MAKFLLTVIVCFVKVSRTIEAADWSYDNSAAKGPKNWDGLCDGQKQSPIDINTTSTEYDSSLGTFTLVNYDSTPNVNFTTTNNGHTLKISFPPFMYNVSGGGLTGTYTTAQFHLHWGSTNSNGSEHAVDSKLYPAEIHFVSFNTQYPNLSVALSHDDGLAVLGVFIKVGSANNAGYEKFLASAYLPINASTEMHVPTFKFIDLLPSNKTAYFRYNGSLTTPTCNEVVTWTVFKEAVEISQAQMNALRSLKTNDSKPLVDNFRPLQDIGSRKVMSSFEIEKPTSTAASTDTSTAASTDAPTVDSGSGAGVKISNAVMLLVLISALFFH